MKIYLWVCVFLTIMYILFFLMDINSKKLFLEIVSSLWPFCHLRKMMNPGVIMWDSCRSDGECCPSTTRVNIPLTSSRVLSSTKVAENHYHPQRGICYPTFLWFETEQNKEQCKFLIWTQAESQRLPSRISCPKLIGTVEFQWVPATPRLNIRCIKDPSKNGY